MREKELLAHECRNLIAYWTARFMYYFPDTVTSVEGKRLLPLLPFLQQMLTKKGCARGCGDSIDNWLDNLDTEIESTLKLIDEESDGQGKVNYEEIKKSIRKNMNRLRRNAWNLNKNFLNKFHQLCSILEIGKQEQKLLMFAIILNTCEPFKELLEMFECGYIVRLKAISFMLNLDVVKVKNFFTGNSRIAQLGLITMERSFGDHIFFEIDFLDGLEAYLFFNGVDHKDIFKNCFSKVLPSQFQSQDFDHIDERDLLQTFLEQSIRSQTIGTNILIHGPSGSGKTEFVKSLHSAGFQLYEVPPRNHKGESISEIKRLMQYRIAQKILTSNQKAVLVMDDADFILDEGISFFNMFFRSDNSSELSKAAMNRLLETNSVPTIWVCNASQEINRAFKRRFGMIVPIEHLPKKARARMLSSYFGKTKVSSEWLEYLSHLEIHPGIISRCAETLNLICRDGTKSQEETERIALSLLSNMMKLSGKPPVRMPDDTFTLPFVMDAINANYDIVSLVNVLNKKRQGRFLFYGSPGTGKTALVKEIAKRLDTELILKHASDLLSPYVGETESNIAALFATYSAKDCILFIDEADSLFWSRDAAVRSWEVTMVNEILSRMESFDGLFICATNHLDIMDKAVMRRFDMKVEFRLMLPEQAWKLFVAIFGDHARESHKRILESLTLTLGNFGTVFRRLKLYENVHPFTPEFFIKELLTETGQEYLNE